MLLLPVPQGTGSLFCSGLFLFRTVDLNRHLLQPLLFMRVRVLFFGRLKDLAGKASDILELPEGSTVTDLLKHYESGIPHLKDSLSSMAVAVNQEYAGVATKLKSDDEV